jgi:mRNA interferase RelE/StbE
MAWKVELSPGADRDLDKLDPQHARRILKFLFERVAHLDNPRSIGEALQGQRLEEFWRYRVGDYRLICRIQDERLVVLVI